MTCRRHSQEARPAGSYRRHRGHPAPSIPNPDAVIPCQAVAAFRGPAAHQRSAATVATCWACRPYWAAENSAAVPACHPCWAAASAVAAASGVVPASEAAAASGVVTASEAAVASGVVTAFADAASTLPDEPSAPPDATSLDGRRPPRLPCHAGHRAPRQEQQQAPSRRHTQAIGAFQ